MGFFDLFKKKGSADNLDAQIAELQAKNAAAAADADVLKAAQDAEKFMNAFSADTLSGSAVSNTDAMGAAKLFDSLAGTLGVKTDMTKTTAQKIAFDAPDVIKNKKGVLSEDGNNYVYGVDSEGAPAIYCVETQKIYAPGWECFLEMVENDELFDILGEECEDIAEVISEEYYETNEFMGSTIIGGLSSQNTPTIFCRELQKAICFSWQDILGYAIYNWDMES